MLNNIISRRSAVTNSLGIEIDRILIFVETTAEIAAFRKLNLYYFEVTQRNLEQGTISNIFFLKDIALELIKLEDLELASRHAAQTNVDIVARTRWQSNQAIPFGFVLRYASDQHLESRRRCYSHQPQEGCTSNIQPYLQVNFSSKNLQELQEPICYIVPQSLACQNLLDNTSAIKQRLLFHQSRTSKLTNIKVTLNTSKPLTNTISLISTLSLINIKQGDYPKLELEFDNGYQVDLLATFLTIPLIISY